MENTHDKTQPIFWQAEITNIQEMLNKKIPVPCIGKKYGVSTSRIYQVMTQFGLHSVFSRKKNILRDAGPKYFWVANILRHRKEKKHVIDKLLDNFHIPDVCPVTELILDYAGGKGTHRSNSPNLRRIDKGEGYEHWNVIIWSCEAKIAKNDANHEYHNKACEYLESFML